jgi:hypothetical protein
LKFEEFLNKSKQEEVVGDTIDGSFSCHTCRVSVDEAEYFQMQKILRFTCPEGHTTYIEDFKLF